MTLQAMTFVSCIYDNTVVDDMPTTDYPQTALISINVGILGDSRTRAGETQISNEDTKLKSLRVVITDEEGKVEINDKVEIDQPVTEKSLLYLVSVGPKKVFLIGNADNIPLFLQTSPTEENDDNDTSSETPEQPAQRVSTTASKFFSMYQMGTPGFEEAVNNLYFENTYIEGVADTSSPRDIPLTSVYDIEAKAGGNQEFEFWLVRAATKYSIYFTNKREEAVFLRKLSISSPETEMFLMPHVGKSQQTINDNYWIDWLRNVSDASQEQLDDQNWNSQQGWITDYLIPANSAKYEFTPVETNQDEDRYKIAGSTTETGTTNVIPGKLELGPFYATEGKNLAEGEPQNGLQSYTLNLMLHDIADGKDVVLSRTLPTLGALFRNTHVIIYVEFDEAWMHIYGEIGKWDLNPTAFGTANPE